MADDPRPPDAMPPQPNRMRPMQPVDPRPPELPVESQEFLDEVRRHLEYDLDPAVEAVQDKCPTCGAYMLNPALHRDWHDKYRQRINEIAAEAARYKPAPRYEK